MFSRDYKDLKGLIEEMEEMKIDLLLESKPVKKIHYKLAHKYKDMVKIEIENMLVAWTLYLVNQS